MELKVFRDSLWAAGSSCTVKSEISIEAEILISDYLPQVFKIVKTFVKLVVLQKHMQQGRLMLDGYLRCVVYYQGEDGKGLCQTEQKVPFTKALDIPQFEFSTWSAIIGGEVEYLNCRAVNGRRIEIRGAFGLSATINTQIQKELVSTLADCGVQQKQVTLQGVKNIACVDKLITTENEFVFSETPSCVLDISGTGQCKDIKLVLGKAVIKGEVQAVITYRSQSEGLKSQAVQLPINYILDIDGITDDCICKCIIEPVGFTMVTNDDTDAQTQLSATVILHVYAMRKYEINAASDAFSTKYETEVIKQSLVSEQFVKELDEIHEVSVIGQLSDENSELIACFVNMSSAEVTQTELGTAICAKGMLTILCNNSIQEIENIDKVFELCMPIDMQTTAENIHLESWLFADVIQCNISTGQLEAKVQVNVQGMLLKRENTFVLADVAIGEEWMVEDPDISLRIYYAEMGENVFDIARDYHISPSDMMCVNGLEKEVLQTAKRLLVPSVS